MTGDDEKAYLKKIWWEKLILGDDQGVMSRDMGWRFLIFCSSLNDGLGNKFAASWSSPEHQNILSCTYDTYSIV